MVLDLGRLRTGTRTRLVACAAICVVSFASVAGCGPALVDPGRTRPRAAPVPNPALDPTVTPSPSGLPVLETPDIQQSPVESVLPLTREPQADRYHTVQSGETLASIARRYQITAEQVRSANGLDASSALKPQQLLFIPPNR